MSEHQPLPKDPANKPENATPGQLDYYTEAIIGPAAQQAFALRAQPGHLRSVQNSEAISGVGAMHAFSGGSEGDYMRYVTDNFQPISEIGKEAVLPNGQVAVRGGKEMVSPAGRVLAVRGGKEMVSPNGQVVTFEEGGIGDRALDGPKMKAIEGRKVTNNENGNVGYYYTTDTLNTLPVGNLPLQIEAGENGHHETRKPIVNGEHVNDPEVSSRENVTDTGANNAATDRESVLSTSERQRAIEETRDALNAINEKMERLLAEQAEIRERLARLEGNPLPGDGAEWNTATADNQERSEALSPDKLKTIYELMHGDDEQILQGTEKLQELAKNKGTIDEYVQYSKSRYAEEHKPGAQPSKLQTDNVDTVEKPENGKSPNETSDRKALSMALERLNAYEIEEMIKLIQSGNNQELVELLMTNLAKARIDEALDAKEAPKAEETPEEPDNTAVIEQVPARRRGIRQRWNDLKATVISAPGNGRAALVNDNEGENGVVVEHRHRRHFHPLMAAAIGAVGVLAFLDYRHNGGANTHNIIAATKHKQHTGVTTSGGKKAVTGTGSTATPKQNLIPGTKIPETNVALDGAREPWNFYANKVGPENAMNEINKLVAFGKAHGVPIRTKELPGYGPTGQRLVEVIVGKNNDTNTQDAVDVLEGIRSYMASAAAK
jgi:hypothetical protein